MAENDLWPLPQGWMWTTLGEATDTTRRRVKPQQQPGLRFIGMEHVEAHTMRLLGTVPAGEMRSSAEGFLPGDVLYGRLRPYLNKVHAPDFDGLCSAEFIVFRQMPHIYHKYLQYFLNSWAFVTFASHLNEGDRPRVNFTQLAAYPFPLPPLPEQHRIVAAIETQFTRLDAGIAALKRVQARLRRYRAAVLQAACEGRLVPTEAELARAEGRDYEPAGVLLQRILTKRRARWEAEHPGKRYQEPEVPDTSALPELPEGWVWALLSQMSGHVTSGSRGWARYYRDAGSLFVRVGNFDRLSTAVKLDSVVFVEAPKGSEAERTRLQLGDLLITITADVGMVGVVDEHVLGWAEAFINQHVALVRPIEKEPMRFVAWAVASELVQRQIERKQYGATKKGLGLEDVKALSVPLPPLAEQHRIVAEVERRLSVAQEMEEQLELALRRVEQLRQAILKRAFEGRLVAQDLKDEPASALLERIRAERQAQSMAGPRQPGLPAMAGAGPKG